MEISERDVRRLFFGAQVKAPWPEEYPPGRCIAKESRHITLAFLGSCDFSLLRPLLPEIPLPKTVIGQTGIAESLVFLPPESPRVAATTVEWTSGQEDLLVYQQEITAWLIEKGNPLKKGSFFPHISIARTPFNRNQWISNFTPLPFFVNSIALYQSMGNLHYDIIWEHPLLAPFEELDHTADIAFTIRGRTPQEIHQNAQIALAFHFPPLISFFKEHLEESVESIVIALNQSIGLADTALGCPFKAVSFHGNIHHDARKILTWEMIVDV